MTAIPQPTQDNDVKLIRNGGNVIKMDYDDLIANIDDSDMIKISKMQECLKRIGLLTNERDSLLRHLSLIECRVQELRELIATKTPYLQSIGVLPKS